MEVIRAVGDYAVIELERERSSGGIISRFSNTGIVLSCKKDTSLEGRVVMFSTRPEYQTHNDLVFVPHNMILCVVKKE